MPPTHKIEVFKDLGGENWCNTWLVDAASLDIAAAAAGEIVDAERAFHISTVLFTYSRVSTLTAGDNVYTTVPANVAGTRSGVVGQLLPLWITLRADLPTGGGGRPSRKYYRGVLAEGDISFSSFESSIVQDVVNALNGLIGGISSTGASLVDPDGQPIFGTTVYPRPQMRQLHRKRRRATTT